MIDAVSNAESGEDMLPGRGPDPRNIADDQGERNGSNPDDHAQKDAKADEPSRGQLTQTHNNDNDGKVAHNQNLNG